RGYASARDWGSGKRGFAAVWVKCFRETGRCAAKPRAGVSHGWRSTRISVGSHEITFNKACAQEQERADVVRARRRGMREQGIFDLAHLVFIDETADNTRCCGFTAIAGAASA